MMSDADIDLTLYFRRKHTPPPSVLLLTLSNDTSNKNPHHRISPSMELRSHQKKNRPLPHMIGLHVNNLDVHDTSSSSFGWQRRSDKIIRLTPAPDVAYRNTYMEECKKEKSKIINGNHRSHSRSPSPRNQQSPQLKIPNSSSETFQQKHQHYTVYDYIRDSIRQIERQRNLKHENISSRIKRPQNDDNILRRVLGEKKSSGRPSLSRSSSMITTTTTTRSSLINNHLKSPQSFVNYIKYSRVLQSPISNNEYNQQQSILTQT